MAWIPLLALLLHRCTAELLVSGPVVRRVGDDDAANPRALRAGDHVTLHCLTVPDSADLLHMWYRNGVLLEHSVGIRGKYLDIESVDHHTLGSYRCSIAVPGEEPRYSGDYMLSVHGESRQNRATPLAPAMRFNPPPVDKKVELNTTARIHCKVLGGLQPNVTWFRNKEEPLDEEVMSVNGTLTFSPARRHHRGEYTCVAADTAHTINHTIRVDVVVMPRVVSPAAGAVMSVSLGAPLWVHCTAVGEPEPTTHWDRDRAVLTSVQVAVEGEDGKFVGNNTRIRLYRNGTLAIESARAEDEERYGCIAGSAAGLDRHEITLKVYNGSESAGSESGVGGKAVVVSISVAAAYMVLVLALMLYCRQRRRRRSRRGEKIEMNSLEGGEEKLMDSDGKAKSNGAAQARNGRLKSEHEIGAARSDNSEVSAASRASRRSNHYDQLAVPRDLLTEQITLGRGEFGEVHMAKVDVRKLRRQQTRDDKPHADDEPRIKPVMVKALTSHEEAHLAEFRRELEMFSRVRHECVARLLALCTDAEPHLMVLECTDWGDLKQFLLATRTAAEAAAARGACTSRHGAAPLAAAQVGALATQLARAGRAIAAARFTHRDIAARNCLISSRLQLKLSLPALSRGPHSSEYYKHLNQVLPLRWLPLEAVQEADYSTKSDVYMFAVTVWEMFHKGELPYPKLSDASVLTQLTNNTLRLVWNDTLALPAPLLALMERCMSVSPAQRPLFDDICREMSDICQTLLPAPPTIE